MSITHRIAIKATYPGLYMVAVLLFFSNAHLAVASPDIADIVGPNECGECHKKEVEAWRGTHHFSTFKELSRTKDAKQIAKNLGLKRIKTEGDCVSCHFTRQLVGGSPEAVAGISCESCHGGAKNWMDIHNDYGGKDVKKEAETAAHKETRIAQSLKAGLISPSDIYSVANNCYQCHLVPNEKLVNVGGHKAGSPFELVSWSQGEVRHNYFSSADGKENANTSPERKRMMYIVGNLLELEHALRAISKATQKAKYAVTMAKRVKLAIKRLNKLAAVINDADVNAIITIGTTAKLKLNNEAELKAAADNVARLAKKFAASHTGSEFAALDALLPDPSKFKGTAAR